MKINNHICAGRLKAHACAVQARRLLCAGASVALPAFSQVDPNQRSGARFLPAPLTGDGGVGVVHLEGRLLRQARQVGVLLLQR